MNVDSKHDLDGTVCLWYTTEYLVLCTLHSEFYILVHYLYTITFSRTYMFSCFKTQISSVIEVILSQSLQNNNAAHLFLLSSIYQKCFDYENTVYCPISFSKPRLEEG
jgi:hypothetical protein